MSGVRQKTETEILNDKNINAIKATLRSQSETISQQAKEIASLKTGMVQTTNNFNQFKVQVQTMIAKNFGSGPTVR